MKKKPKILIIRFSSIGDIVLTTPIVRGAKQQLEAEVHYLTKKSFAGVIRNNPNVDKVYMIHNKVNEILPTLKRENYDCIIDLHNNLRTRRLKAHIRVKSYTFDKLNIKKWITVNFKWNILPDKHIVDRYYEAVTPLGIHPDHQGLEYFVNEESEAQAYDIVKDIKSYEVLVLGANYYTKRIPKSLASDIIRKADHPIILLGGKDVKTEADALAELHPVETINLSGRTSLNVSAAIISKAKTVHTGDTGLMHIAAAYRRQIHVYWGNTVPQFGMYAYLPKGGPSPIDHEVIGLSCRPCSKLGHQQCPKGHFKCMLEQRI